MSNDDRRDPGYFTRLVQRLKTDPDTQRAAVKGTLAVIASLVVLAGVHRRGKRKGYDLGWSNGVHAGRMIGLRDGLDAGHTVGQVVGAGNVAKSLGYQLDLETLSPKQTRKLQVAETTIRELEAPDAHAHQCSGCGRAWQHGDENAGDEGAHTCPACGQVEWVQA